MDNSAGIEAAVERAEAVMRRQGEAQHASALATRCASDTMAGMHSKEGLRVNSLKAALRASDNEGDIIAIAAEIVRAEDEMRRLGRIHDVIVATRAS